MEHVQRASCPQHDAILYANVEWNLTYGRLNKADFPLDQLLDYLPDNSVDWIFEPAQWNSSWRLECHSTPLTSIQLRVTGNCTEPLSELPDLDEALSITTWDNYAHNWNGFHEAEAYKDILFFVIGTSEADYNEREDTFRSMRFMIASVHMHHVPINQNDSSTCEFGVGPIDSSSYTKVECELRRRDDVEDYMNLAFPDIGNYAQRVLSTAFSSYYGARLAQESTSDSPISIITPDELIRFYQTYTIVKDLQYRQPVTRRLNVDLSVVQISTVFITIAGLVALLILCGLASYALFAICHYEIMVSTPQSKLDWMLQSIQAEDRPFADSKGRLRRSVTVESSRSSQAGGRISGRRREFEAAKYGAKATTTRLPRDSTTETMYDGSPLMNQVQADARESWNSRSSPKMMQVGKTPLVGQTVPVEETSSPPR